MKGKKRGVVNKDAFEEDLEGRGNCQWTGVYAVAERLGFTGREEREGERKLKERET